MEILSDIQNILNQARQKAYQSINLAMVQAYWLIGKRVVEEDQQGESRAVYGKALLKTLSSQLNGEFGKGFSVDNLQNMRLFYLKTMDSEPPNFKLSWSHYLILIAIKEPTERAFYEIEAIENNWSLRQLKRQYDSGLHMRLALSTDKIGIKQLAEKGHILENPTDAIKEPYILEF